MVLKCVDEYHRLTAVDEYALQPTKQDWNSLLNDEDDPLLTKHTLFRGARVYFDHFVSVREEVTRPSSWSGDGDGGNDVLGGGRGGRGGAAYELVDECGEIEVSMRMFKLMLGDVSDVIDANITYVVVDREDLSRASDIKAALKRVRLARVRQTNSRIVSQEWIQHVIDSGAAWDEVGVPSEFEVIL
jgi:hypothetical protein